MSKQARKLRSIISLLLSAVMAVSCFSVSAAAACEESGAEGALPPPKVNFVNTLGWDEVYIYAWDADGNSILGDWPGTPLYYYYDGGDDFEGVSGCSTDLPYSFYKAEGFVFNSGVNGECTVALEYTEAEVYYTTGKRDSDGNYFVYPYSHNSSYYSIDLMNNRNWTDVYVYALDLYGNELEGEWPGHQVTSKYFDEYGRELYTYNYPYGTAEIIFNNGHDERTEIITDFVKVEYYITDKTDESGNYSVDLLSNMDYHYGDVDYDGSITISDATDISFHLAQFEGRELSYLQKALADVNADGVVSIADVTTIQFRLAELNDNSKIGEECKIYDYSETNTRLNNETDWEIIYAYLTDKNGNQINGDWPGVLIPKQNEGYTVKSYSYFNIPKEAESVIFSNGNKRTVEITDLSRVESLTILDSQDETGQYNVSEKLKYKYRDKDVKFINSQGWEDVNVFAWDEDGEPLMGEWPGTAMNYIEDNDFGDGIYSATIPKEAIGMVFYSKISNDYTEDIMFDDYEIEYYLTTGERDEMERLLVYDERWLRPS